SIHDLAGNGLAPGIGDVVGQVYTIDHEAPGGRSFVSNTPGKPDPFIAGNLLTNASSISYTLTFSKTGTGLVPSEVALASTGSISVASIQVQPISGSNGTAYSVTVNGISGQGTLGLDLADNGGINDLAGNGLPPGGGTVVGQVYTIDTNPP